MKEYIILRQRYKFYIKSVTHKTEVQSKLKKGKLVQREIDNVYIEGFCDELFNKNHSPIIILTKEEYERR